MLVLVLFSCVVLQVRCVGGRLFSWGKGKYGQLGHGDTRTQPLPKEIKKGSLSEKRNGGTTGIVSVTGVTGAFAASETITGNTSSVTATVAAINKRDLRDFKGDVLYVENRLPVSRSSDQSEDIKLIVRY